MKQLLTILFLACFFFSKGQVPQVNNGYGYQFKALIADSGLIGPVRDTLNWYWNSSVPFAKRIGAKTTRPQDSLEYRWTGLRWLSVGSGSGTNIYNTNGTLTGDRTIAGGLNSLTFNGLSSFNVTASDAVSVSSPAYVAVTSPSTSVSGRFAIGSMPLTTDTNMIAVVWDSVSNRLSRRKISGGGGGGTYTAGYAMLLNSGAFRADTTILGTQARIAAGLFLKQDVLAPFGSGTTVAGNLINLGGSVSQETDLDFDETYGFSLSKLNTLKFGLPSKANNTALIGDLDGNAAWGKINPNMLSESLKDTLTEKLYREDSTTANPTNYVTQYQRKKTSDSLAALIGAAGWSLTGNSATSQATNFIGTTDTASLNFRVNNQQSGHIGYDLANTFFGWKTPGFLNGTFGQNSAFGSDALRNLTLGESNTAVGYYSLNNNTTGGENVGIGTEAGSTITTGNNNTAVGSYANTGTTGSNNTVIGSAMTTQLANRSNQLTIGAGNIKLTADSIGAITLPYYAGAANADSVMGFNTSGKIVKKIAAGGYTLDTTTANTSLVTDYQRDTATANRLTAISGKANNLLTGFSNVIGQVTASDSVLSAIQKLDGTGRNYMKANIGSGGTIHFFGSSITAAAPGPTSTAYSYAAMLGNMLGMTVVNNGVGSSSSYAAVKSAYATTNLKSFPVFAELGINDLRAAPGGGTGNSRTYEKMDGCKRALIANHFLSGTGTPANSGSITQGGTWTTVSSGTIGEKASNIGGLALQTTVNGSTLTYTSTGSTVVIGTFGVDSTTQPGGSFSVTIDGTVYTSFDNRGKADAVTDGLGNQNAVTQNAVIITGLSTGSHTVVITVTSLSASGKVFIDYVGTLAPPTKCQPLVFLSVPKMNTTGYATGAAGGNDSTFTRADLRGQAVINELPAYPVYYAYTNDGFNPATDLYSDSIHRNDAGQRKIAKAVMNVIGNSNISSQFTARNSSTISGYFGQSGSGTYMGTNRNPATGVFDDAAKVGINYQQVVSSSDGYHEWFVSGTNNAVPTAAMRLDKNGVLILQDAAASQATHFQTTASTLQLWVNRNPATGTFYNTGKASSAIVMVGQSSDAHIQFWTSPTNNTVPVQNMTLDKNGVLMLGTTTANGSALFEIQSTTKGFAMPRMTTAQRTAISSPARGLAVYDTTKNTVETHNGTAWQTTQRAGYIALTDAATITWNVLNGMRASVTLAGNRTLSITNAIDGDYGELLVTQDATGSRTLTTACLTPDNGVPLALSTGAGKVDLIAWRRINGKFYFNIVAKDFVCP